MEPITAEQIEALEDAKNAYNAVCYAAKEAYEATREAQDAAMKVYDDARKVYDASVKTCDAAAVAYGDTCWAALSRYNGVREDIRKAREAAYDAAEE